MSKHRAPVRLTPRGEAVVIGLMMAIAIIIGFTTKSFWWSDHPNGEGWPERPAPIEITVDHRFPAGAIPHMNETHVQCLMQCDGGE